MEYLRSDVYRVKRKGANSVSLGAPVVQTTSDKQSCSLSVRYAASWSRTPTLMESLNTHDLKIDRGKERDGCSPPSYLSCKCSYCDAGVSRLKVPVLLVPYHLILC